MYRMAPLPSTFMLTSILGFLVVTIYTASGRFPADWGVSFGLVFVLMFIASIVSITPTFPRERLDATQSRNAGKKRVARKRKA